MRGEKSPPGPSITLQELASLRKAEQEARHKMMLGIALMNAPLHRRLLWWFRKRLERASASS